MTMDDIYGCDDAGAGGSDDILRDDDDGCGGCCEDSNNVNVDVNDNDDDGVDNDENSNNNNNSDDDDDDDNYPWEWYNAMKDILNSNPPVTVTTLPIPNSPVQVLPWLYLAPMHCVHNHEEQLAKELGITHVISMNRMPPNKLETFYWTLRSNDIDQLYIDALDTIDYNILDNHWDECCTFLQQIVNGNNRINDNNHGDDDDSNNNNNKKDDGEQEEEEEERLNEEDEEVDEQEEEQQLGVPKYNKVLVHCAAGMNRSGLIVAATMIYFEQMDLLDVITQLKRQRGYILSNESFQKELLEFAWKHNRLGPRPRRPPPPK